MFVYLFMIFPLRNNGPLNRFDLRLWRFWRGQGRTCPGWGLRARRISEGVEGSEAEMRWRSLWVRWKLMHLTQIYHDLAMVWSKNEIKIDSKLVAVGCNAITLHKVAGEWKITSIADTAHPPHPVE